MYSDDSFHTLSGYGQMSVLALSAVLLALTGIVSFLMMRGRRGSVRFAVAVSFFTVFVWLSPQAYYTLYGFLIEGLPRQLVVDAPPPLDKLWRLVTFNGPQTLSSHGQGAFFWALTLLSFLVRTPATMASDPDL